MTAPILTLEAALAWSESTGVRVHVFSDDPRTPLPKNAHVAAIEAVRQLTDATPPLERVTPSPPEFVPAAKRSLGTAMRTGAEIIRSLRRGALEVGDHETARALWNMAQNLVALAARVSP